MNKLERKRAWRLTMYAQFCIQRTNAKARAIFWELTYDQWKSLWDKSGKWNERGTKLNQYCMCRYNDVGPYSIDNVRIDTVLNNRKENAKLIERNQGRFVSKNERHPSI